MTTAGPMNTAALDDRPEPAQPPGAAAIMRPSFARRQMFVALLVLTPVVLWLTATWSERFAVEAVRDEGRNRLALYTAGLRSELDKFDYLPRILAENKDVSALLRDPGNDGLATIVNTHLEQVNDFANAAATYVMGTDGTTLAASNWLTDISFVGRNFRFRPYFQDAMQGKTGRYFALGTTSRQPGYYVAHPVARGSTVLGVIVVKVGMDRLERTWADEGRQTVMVTDADGIVFITSRPDWKFNALAPLGDTVLERIRQSRQYETADLKPLAITTLATNGPGDRTVTAPDGRGRPVEYLMQSRTLPGTGWTIHALSPLAKVDRTVLTAVGLAVLTLFILFLAALFMTQRRARLQERLAYQRQIAETLERSRALLERRVRDRTRDLETVNTQLRQQIEETRRAEENLRLAQDELVQAGKLAVLGQISSGINHELNQPLGAIRAYADNARAFLDRDRTEEARENLSIISELTDRMAAIVTRLKGFARKSSGETRPMPVLPAVMDALALFGPQIKAAGVRVENHLPGNADILVIGDTVRLGQVLVNLLSNAVDAMADAADKTLRISVEEDGEAVLIKVTDTGTGIPPDVLPHVFDPFFTTKESGKGLGLGLPISYGIVRDFGGALTAVSNPQGGATFTVTLRRSRAAHAA